MNSGHLQMQNNKQQRARGSSVNSDATRISSATSLKSNTNATTAAAKPSSTANASKGKDGKSSDGGEDDDFAYVYKSATPSPTNSSAEPRSTAKQNYNSSNSLVPSASAPVFRSTTNSSTTSTPAAPSSPPKRNSKNNNGTQKVIDGMYANDAFENGVGGAAASTPLTPPASFTKGSGVPAPVPTKRPSPSNNTPKNNPPGSHTASTTDAFDDIPVVKVVGGSSAATSKNTTMNNFVASIPGAYAVRDDDDEVNSESIGEAGRNTHDLFEFDHDEAALCQSIEPTPYNSVINQANRRGGGRGEIGGGGGATSAKGKVVVTHEDLEWESEPDDSDDGNNDNDDPLFRTTSINNRMGQSVNGASASHIARLAASMGAKSNSSPVLAKKFSIRKLPTSASSGNVSGIGSSVNSRTTNSNLTSIGGGANTTNSSSGRPAPVPPLKTPSSRSPSAGGNDDPQPTRPPTNRRSTLVGNQIQRETSPPSPTTSDIETSLGRTNSFDLADNRRRNGVKGGGGEFNTPFAVMGSGGDERDSSGAVLPDEVVGAVKTKHRRRDSAERENRQKSMGSLSDVARAKHTTSNNNNSSSNGEIIENENKRSVSSRGEEDDVESNSSLVFVPKDNASKSAGGHPHLSQQQLGVRSDTGSSATDTTQTPPRSLMLTARPNIHSGLSSPNIGAAASPSGSPMPPRRQSLAPGSPAFLASSAASPMVGGGAAQKKVVVKREREWTSFKTKTSKPCYNTTFIPTIAIECFSDIVTPTEYGLDLCETRVTPPSGMTEKQRAATNKRHILSASQQAKVNAAAGGGAGGGKGAKGGAPAAREMSNPMLGRVLVGSTPLPKGTTLFDLFHMFFDDDHTLLIDYHVGRKETENRCEKWKPVKPTASSSSYASAFGAKMHQNQSSAAEDPSHLFGAGQRTFVCNTIVKVVGNTVCVYTEFQRYAFLRIRKENAPALPSSVEGNTSTAYNAFTEGDDDIRHYHRYFVTQISGQAKGAMLTDTFRAETLVVYEESDDSYDPAAVEAERKAYKEAYGKWKSNGSVGEIDQPLPKRDAVSVASTTYGTIQFVKSQWGVIKNKIIAAALDDEMPAGYKKMNEYLSAKITPIIAKDKEWADKHNKTLLDVPSGGMPRLPSHPPTPNEARHSRTRSAGLVTTAGAHHDPLSYVFPPRSVDGNSAVNSFDGKDGGTFGVKNDPLAVTQYDYHYSSNKLGGNKGSGGGDGGSFSSPSGVFNSRGEGHVRTRSVSTGRNNELIISPADAVNAFTSPSNAMHQRRPSIVPRPPTSGPLRSAASSPAVGGPTGPSFASALAGGSSSSGKTSPSHRGGAGGGSGGSPSAVGGWYAMLKPEYLFAAVLKPSEDSTTTTENLEDTRNVVTVTKAGGGPASLVATSPVAIPLIGTVLTMFAFAALYALKSLFVLMFASTPSADILAAAMQAMSSGAPAVVGVSSADDNAASSPAATSVNSALAVAALFLSYAHNTVAVPVLLPLFSVMFAFSAALAMEYGLVLKGLLGL